MYLVNNGFNKTMIPGKSSAGVCKQFKNNTYSGPIGAAAGGGAIGGGYLQTTVIISSPSISRPGWNLTTMLLVNTR